MIHFKIYTAISELPKTWDELATQDIMLKTNYLSALEKSSPSTISLYFIGVFKDSNLVGVALVQRVELYAKDMFRMESASQLMVHFKGFLAHFIKGNILVVGNLTHTGQHGIYFDENNITQSEFIESIFSASNELIQFIKTKKGKSIRSVLFKDYFKDDSIHKETIQFKKHKYHRVDVQPNMLLRVRPNWNSTEDYLTDLNTKYRTRYNRARKKLGKIHKQELDFEDVQNQSLRLYQLYKNVSDNAGFNTFVLPEHHFSTFKKELGDNFKVFGYFLNEELIGFYTLLVNDNQLETYFLGYDKAHQYKNQLYLNMLYDMIEFAIINNMKTIVYARTAMEIKSSVGARPYPMSMYIKHTNGLVNAILPSVFGLMNPQQPWEERHPFK